MVIRYMGIRCIHIHKLLHKLLKFSDYFLTNLQRKEKMGKKKGTDPLIDQSNNDATASDLGPNSVTQASQGTVISGSKGNSCCTKTELKICIRFDRNISPSLIATYMSELTEDECAMAVMEFVEQTFVDKSLVDRAEMASFLLGIRGSQDAADLAKFVPEERHRSSLTSMLLDPPKKAKKHISREGEKEGSQLTMWTGSERPPALGGQLWEVQEDKFQTFAAECNETQSKQRKSYSVCYTFMRSTPSDLRRLVIEKLKNGLSVRKISSDLQLSVGNVSNIKKKYLPNLVNKQKTGRLRKLTETCSNRVRRLITSGATKDTVATSKRLRDEGVACFTSTHSGFPSEAWFEGEEEITEALPHEASQSSTSCFCKEVRALDARRLKSCALYR